MTSSGTVPVVLTFWMMDMQPALFSFFNFFPSVNIIIVIIFCVVWIALQKSMPLFHTLVGFGRCNSAAVVVSDRLCLCYRLERGMIPIGMLRDPVLLDGL